MSIDLIRKPAGGGHPILVANGHSWRDVLAGVIRHGRVLEANIFCVHPWQKRLLDPIFAVGPGARVDLDGTYHYAELTIKFDEHLALTAGELIGVNGYVAFVRGLPYPPLSDEERKSHRVWGG